MTLLVVGYGLTTSPTVAQQSGIIPILTWHAESFRPADFKGKPFPTRGTKVTVSLDATIGASFADLSRDSIAWYQNDRQFASGVGLTTVTATAAGDRNGRDVFRVVAQGGHPIEMSVVIPVATPRVSIEIIPGAPRRIRALPLFFNVESLSDLSFSWQISIPNSSGSSPDERLLEDSSLPLQGYVVVQNRRTASEYVRQFMPLP